MNNHNDAAIAMTDIILQPEHAVDQDLFISPLERDFGSEPDIEMKQLRLRIGKRPLARNLLQLYELSNREVPENLEVFISYDIWMLTHAISIIKEGGFKRVKQIGYQMSFQEKPKITVIEVLPQTRFIKKVGAFFENVTDLEINGQATVPKGMTQLLDHVESLSFGGKLTVSNHANITARLSFSVMTPIVIATGIGDNNSEWVFTKDEEPLLGDQLMTQIVLTPKYLREINFKARLYTTISTFDLLPMRLKSDWIELGCDLR